MAGNLLGQGFDEYVVKQINKRQEIYGSINRNNEIIQFLNNKTAFLRLSSGTQVDKLIDGLKIENKNFVLFNGVSSLNNNTISQKSGITRTNSGTINTNHAYGFGGLDYGQSPMPGLISANIKSLNRGALREGDITIKAFNTVQFNIIDALYLRLGHYVFLEWGWSSYFDDNGSYTQNTSYYELCQKFMNASLTIDEILKNIEKQRQSSGGNYDGFLARIVNFSWSRSSDGTYDISLKVRGVGDVIESLKINVLNSDAQSELQNQENKKDKDERTDPPQTFPTDASSQEVIRSAARKNSMGAYFYGIYKDLFSQGNNISTYSDPSLKTDKIDFALINYNYPGLDGDDRELYIRLGSLFQWIETNIMLAFKDKNKKISKALFFDKDIEKNLIYVDSLQIPIDPRICIFNKIVTLNDPDGTSKTVELFPGIDKFISNKSFNNNQYGQIMNIYINCGFILKKIDEQKDKDGNTALISFLNSIFSDVNNAIGGNNRLEATIDPTTDNKIIIIDNNQLPDRDDILKAFGLETELAKFEVYGYVNRDNTSKAGFVKGFEFKTEITPQMSTMITVGGTSNGNTQHQDSTALSAVNEGTINLYAEESLDNENSNTTTSTDSTTTEKTLEETYKNTIKDFNKFVEGLAEEEPFYDPEDVDSYKSALQQMLQYKEAKANQSKSTDEKKTGSRNIGFIPFNLTLNIEGLSGIKIYQKYVTDGSFLPSSYPDSLDFLTKGVNHTITNNVWETTLESLAVPKKSSTPDNVIPNPSSVEKVASRGNVSVASSSPVTYFQSNLPPNQAKNRVTLTRILDDGTQTLGILEIYNVDRTKIIYTLATVELPWKNNENGKSAIPTGNYLVNSRQTSKYGKHFFIIGSESGQWKRIPGSNPSDRTGVLIHTAPKAPGWLQGCIGPGPQFDFKRKNSKGNPDGVGTNYLDPAKSESTAALNKLVDTFYNDKGFKMEIKNLDNVASNALPKSINDAKIKKLAADARYRDLFKGM